MISAAESSASGPPPLHRHRPPLLPWSSDTWTKRWSAMGRMSTTPVPRTPFLLLKSPVSTLYEEKFGGDRNMFTGESDETRDEGLETKGEGGGATFSFPSLIIVLRIIPPHTPNTPQQSNQHSSALPHIRHLRHPPPTRLTVGMYCSRMTARGMRIGIAIDCTSLDLEEFEPLPASSSSSSCGSSAVDGRVRYFHNPDEWDDYDVEYHRMLPPPHPTRDDDDDVDDPPPLAPLALPEFCRVVSDYLRRSRDVVGDSASASASASPHVAVFDSRGGLGAAAYLVGGYMCGVMRAPVHVALESLRAGTPGQRRPRPGDGPIDDDVMWGLRDARLVRDMQIRFGGKSEVRVDGRRPAWWYRVIDDDDDDGKGGEGEDVDDDEPRRKRRRGGYEGDIVIPPCIPPPTGGGRDREGTIDDSSMPPPTSSSSSLISPPPTGPTLPRDVLEPVPWGSTRWNRAMAVLSQMTTPPSSSKNPTATMIARLPLKPEVDISDVDVGVDDEPVRSVRECPEMYRVTWLPTDGRRGLLLVLSEAVYFMEQSTRVKTTASPSHDAISISIVTKMKFPSPKDHAKTQHRTLLDVVLVTDVEGGRSTYRFYALDLLCIEGGTVWHKPWDQRWRFLNEGVLIPRKKDEAQQNSSMGSMAHVYSDEMIKFRAVEYFPMKKLGFVLKYVCDGVLHEARGVRILSTGRYGIGLHSDSGSDLGGTTSALIWRRDRRMDDSRLKTLLLEAP
ncbi:hypothetical protein ACHAXA_007079 [Cyclostephanos tholiformis]|uniref:mRNA capping enzyme adenylation domain-containing protein n=1 Tax=Cyclostephanos tholiformis TaxID=382380 RepID=A0ABD3RZ31_9STRA